MTDRGQEAPSPARESDSGSKSSLIEAAKSIHFEDFKHLHETPCARPAFLYGIGSAFILGGVQLVLGASMRKATSWGLGSFLGISVVVFEGCHYQRERAKDRIKLIQEAMERKAQEKARQQYLREKALRDIAAEAKQKEEKLKNDRAKWFWQRG